MSSFQTQRIVEAPLQRTFEAFTDFHNAAQNIRAIQKLEVLGDGPVGAGTRFRETRVVFKREATEEMEITAFERPERVVVACDSCGAHFTTDFRFTAEGDRTRVDVHFEAKPVTLMAKLMSPVSALMMKSCLKQFEGDMEDMAALAEGRSQGELAAAT